MTAVDLVPSTAANEQVPVKIPRKARPKKGVALGAPRLPQVDLLPPEVRSGREFAAFKRWVMIGLVCVVLITVAVFAWATMVQAEAEAHLAETQDHAAALSKEKASYSEVTRVLKSISDITEAREHGLSTEVSWTPYVDAIAAVLPKNVEISTFQVEQSTPEEPVLLAAEQLSHSGVGRMLVIANSPTLPVASEWLEALESIPGFTDATLQSSTITDVDGNTFYEVTSTVQVDERALANRFVEAPDEQAQDGAGTEQAGSDAGEEKN